MKYILRTPKGFEDLILEDYDRDNELFRVVGAIDGEGNHVERYKKTLDGAIYGIVNDVERINAALEVYED